MCILCCSAVLVAYSFEGFQVYSSVSQPSLNALQLLIVHLFLLSCSFRLIRLTSATVEKSELIYTEFLESLAALSCYRIPDPFLSLSQRIAEFLEEVIFPAVLDRARVFFNEQLVKSFNKGKQSAVIVFVSTVDDFS